MVPSCENGSLVAWCMTSVSREEASNLCHCWSIWLDGKQSKSTFVIYNHENFCTPRKCLGKQTSVRSRCWWFNVLWRCWHVDFVWDKRGKAALGILEFQVRSFAPIQYVWWLEQWNLHVKNINQTAPVFCTCFLLHCELWGGHWVTERRHVTPWTSRQFITESLGQTKN